MTVNTGPLIVGGVEATPYEFPWIVSIQRSSHSCGGSIVNENWILTAGHCAQGPASTYFIVAGEHNLSLTEGYEQKVEVSRIIVHEGYDE
jgi:trypsin